MASVTKSSGKYFYENDRVWEEAKQSGYEPFLVGNWGGKANLPSQPTKDNVRDLAEGSKFLARLQKNRVGGFDVTPTCDKSISVALFGLTPFERWANESTKLLVKASLPEIEALLGDQQVNSGPQGVKKMPSQGGAFGFAHWESSRGTPHGHIHYFIPNLSISKNGEVKSIANAHRLFESQGVMRARFQKRLDDLLRDEGYRTKRNGRSVAIEGIPDKLIERLSPSRAAMRAAMRKKGFTTPRAQDFYARHARRAAGKRTLGDPAKMNETCRKLAAKYGVTLESLKRPSGGELEHRDKYKAASVAHDVAREARDRLIKKHGTFTKEQFLEQVFVRAIGKSTNFDAVDAVAGAALQNPLILDITRQKQIDGTYRYGGPGSVATVQAAAMTYKSESREAWDDLKRAAKGLGHSAFVATAQGVAGVLTRLAETLNPTPRTLVVDAANLASFIDQHRPTPYLVAHAKALAKGLLSPGKPHDKAFAAEITFASLRKFHRLEKNTVLVVERGSLASARELHLLSKIARRDRASVILADRPRQGVGQSQGRARNVNGNSHDLER
ncbi:MAG: relaxase domain-containing protein [Alphaproteobacteria bacterium]|nr:relaxase domain-containing protein [Alphaproteobacteria bacterium]